MLSLPLQPPEPTLTQANTFCGKHENAIAQPKFINQYTLGGACEKVDLVPSALCPKCVLQVARQVINTLTVDTPIPVNPAPVLK